MMARRAGIARLHGSRFAAGRVATRRSWLYEPGARAARDVKVRCTRGFRRRMAATSHEATFASLTGSGIARGAPPRSDGVLIGAHHPIALHSRSHTRDRTGSPAGRTWRSRDTFGTDRTGARRKRQRAGQAKPAHSSGAARAPVTTPASSPCSPAPLREVESRRAGRAALKPANRARFQVARCCCARSGARSSATRASPTPSAPTSRSASTASPASSRRPRPATRASSRCSRTDAPVRPPRSKLRRDLLIAAGVELSPDELIIATASPKPAAPAGREAGRPAVGGRARCANPFLAPDFSAVRRPPRRPVNRLGNWELIEPAVPLASSTARAAGPPAWSCPRPRVARHAARPRAHAPPGALRREVRAGPPHLPARRRAGPRQDRAGAARRSVANSYPLLVVVPNVVKTNWAREVELWTPEPHRHGRARRRQRRRRVQRRRHRQLRGARPPRRLARPLRLQGHGRRRGALHQEPGSRSARSTCSRSPAASGAHPNGAHDRAHGNAADQLRSRTSGRSGSSSAGSTTRSRCRAHGQARGDRPHPGRLRLLRRGPPAVIDMGIVRRKKVDVAADIPARRIADIPVELDDDLGRSIRAAEAASCRRLVDATGVVRAAKPDAEPRQRPHPRRRPRRARGVEGGERPATTSSRWCARSARRRPRSPPTTRPSSRATSARSCSSPSTSTSWTRPRSTSRGRASRRSRSAATRPRRRARRAIDAFDNDPEVAVVVALAHGGGRRPQPAGRVQRRARRAQLDERRADPGDRPRAPHRSGAARHRVAHHRRAHDRREDRRAHRQQGRPRRPRARRLRRGHRRRFGDSRWGRSWPCFARRSASSRAALTTEEHLSVRVPLEMPTPVGGGPEMGGYGTKFAVYSGNNATRGNPGSGAGAGRFAEYGGIHRDPQIVTEKAPLPGPCAVQLGQRPSNPMDSARGHSS